VVLSQVSAGKDHGRHPSTWLKELAKSEIKSCIKTHVRFSG